MVNIKKLLAMTLVFVLAFTMAAGALTYPAGGYLDGEEINGETLNSIVYLANLGIMNGAPASIENEETGQITQGFKFMPTDTLTRAQFCRMIYSIHTGKDNADLYKNSVVTGFTDVPSGEWYAGFVNYAWLMGWVSGKSATQFDPNGQLKLSEAVTLVLAYLGYDKNDLSRAWPSNAILYGSMKNLFGNGVETSGAVNAPMQRQWAAVLITNSLEATYVTKNDAGRYIDVSAVTVKEARLGNFKEITGTIVANNRFAIEGAAKTNDANKFVVKVGGEMINFSKLFDPMNNNMHTDTQAVSGSINLSDAMVGASVKILYRVSGSSNIIMTYTLNKTATGAVKAADIKVDGAKLTLGSLAAEKTYEVSDFANINYLINGKQYSAEEIGVDSAAELKAFASKFPVNSVLTFTVVDGKIKNIVVTAHTFAKAADITIEKVPTQTPNEFTNVVTMIKIGSTEYKGNTLGSVANSIAKGDYVLYTIDAATGRLSAAKAAKTEGKVDYVIDNTTPRQIIFAGSKLNITSAASVALAVAGGTTADTMVFNTVADSANGLQLLDASVAGLAGKDAFTFSSGGVTYLFEQKTAAVSTGSFFALKPVEIRIVGSDSKTYVLSGLENGAMKTYEVTIKNADIGSTGALATVAANTLYTLNFTDGMISSVTASGTLGVIGSGAGEYTYDAVSKTLTAVTGGNVYILSGASINGFKDEAANTGTAFATGKAIAFRATQIGGTNVYTVSEIYVQQ